MHLDRRMTCVRLADAAILVYDVTSAASFERVRSWIKELKQMVPPQLYQHGPFALISLSPYQAYALNSFKFIWAIQFLYRAEILPHHHVWWQPALLNTA